LVAGEKQTEIKRAPSVPGSVQRRFGFIFRSIARCTMLVELMSLAIHQFKNTLAGQFSFASALTEPNARMFSE